MSWLDRVLARSAPEAAARSTFAPPAPPAGDPDDPELLGEQLQDEASAPAPALAPVAAPALTPAPTRGARPPSAAAPIEQDPPRPGPIAQPAAPAPTVTLAAPARQSTASTPVLSASELQYRELAPSRAEPAFTPREDVPQPRPEPARALEPDRAEPPAVERPAVERRVVERDLERVVELKSTPASEIRTEPAPPRIGELVPAPRQAAPPVNPEAPPSRLSIGRVVVQVQPAPVVVAPAAPRPAPRPRPATPARPSKLRFGLGQS